MTKKEIDDQIAAHVERVCGPVVAEIVASAKARATNNANDLLHDKSTQQLSLRGSTKGLLAGGIIAALAKSKGDLGKAIEIAEKEWKNGELAKALSAGSAADGGVLIAPEYSDEIIDLLLPRTTIRKHVENVTDLSSGTAYVSRLTASAQTSWGGEVQKISPSQQGFGLLTLRARQQKTMVPISNTLLRRGGPRVMNSVRMDTLRAMALGEDSVLLSSPGTEHRPKGMRYWAPTSNVLTATSSPTLDQVTGDIGLLILALENANVGMTAPFWVMAPRTKQALMTMRLPNGPYAFRDEMLTGKLWGYPFESTTHVSTTLGSGNKSELYLADGDELTIGQGPQLQVAMSEEGVIVDDAGNVISAFQQNMTFMRVISEIDFVARHAEAIAVLTGVPWAPGSVTT